MLTLFMPVLALAVIHYATALRKYGLLTPDGLFIASQLLMLYGTVQLIDRDNQTEAYYAQLMAMATATYIIASMLASSVLRRKREDQPAVRRMADYNVVLVAPRQSIVFVIAVSLVVTAAYFTAIGYSAFWAGLQGQLHGDPVDIATLRLDSYAGSTYLFPGYVNQFKNAILPSLTLLVLIWAFTRGRAVARLTALALAAASALALLGTGQRGALVVFLLVIVVYTFLHHRRRVPRAALLPLLMGVPLLLLATIVLARGPESSASPWRAATTDLFTRFTQDNQLSGIAAFNYTSRLPVRNGGEWLEALAGILPGNRGSSLSSEVFYTLYGSTRGTSPPSLWGSAHYNFGLLGTLVVAALLGVLLQLLTRRALRRGSYNCLQLIGYAGVTVVLGTWVAGGIETPLNVGLVSYIGLWYWGGRLNRAGRPSARLAAVESWPRHGASTEPVPAVPLPHRRGGGTRPSISPVGPPGARAPAGLPPKVVRMSG